MHADGPATPRSVLRRVHKHHYKPGQPIEVLPLAFRPNQRDLDGLSVFLTAAEGGTTPEELAVAGDRNPAECIVVELQVSDLEANSLTVVADHSPDAPPGHALIPQINHIDYSAGGERRARLKELTVKLARLASGCVVFPNPSLPEDAGQSAT